jgi:hypothetical protein
MDTKETPTKWCVSHNVFSGTFGVLRTWHVRDENGKVRTTRVQWYGSRRKVFELRSQAQAVADRKNAA